MLYTTLCDDVTRHFLMIHINIMVFNDDVTDIFHTFGLGLNLDC